MRVFGGATPRQTSALVIREGLTLAIAGAAAPSSEIDTVRP